MKFPVIVADPPWSFNDKGNRSSPDHAGVYETMTLDDVLALPVPELAADDAFLFLWCPNSLVLENTPMTVARAWGFEPRQMIPWVKTTKDETRPHIGQGHYTRVCTEMLLLCRRGKATVDDRGVPGVIRSHEDVPFGSRWVLHGTTYELYGVQDEQLVLRSCESLNAFFTVVIDEFGDKAEPAGEVIWAPRGKHSAKPDASYEFVERLCHAGPYVELFARRRYNDNWYVWGNEAPMDERDYAALGG